jgi:hypothetical protein
LRGDELAFEPVLPIFVNAQGWLQLSEEHVFDIWVFSHLQHWPSRIGCEIAAL